MCKNGGSVDESSRAAALYRAREDDCKKRAKEGEKGSCPPSCVIAHVRYKLTATRCHELVRFAFLLLLIDFRCWLSLSLPAPIDERYRGMKILEIA